MQDCSQFSGKVLSVRSPQLKSSQMPTSQLIFPFQIHPLASFLSNLGVSCSALSHAEDRGSEQGCNLPSSSDSGGRGGLEVVGGLLSV